jgi:hypothetical protein
MKRFAPILAALLTLLPSLALAQGAPQGAQPQGDPSVYDDPAMHFQAPAGYKLLGKHPVSEEDLGEDPQTVAGWSSGDKPPKVIVIQQESYDGDLSGFDGVFEQQLRSQFDDALISHKESISLQNGMPAMFMEMTAGSGFNERKGYVVLWADGARGVAITLMAQLGDVDEATAKRVLSDASAVRYPVGR